MPPACRHGAGGRRVVVAPATRTSSRASRHGFSDDSWQRPCRDGCAGDRRAGNGDAHVAQRGTHRRTSQPYAPAACASSSPRRARSPRATSGRDVSHRSNGIAAAIDDALGVTQALIGRSIVVTAGPTVEAIDPVRFVSIVRAARWDRRGSRPRARRRRRRHTRHRSDRAHSAGRRAYFQVESFDGRSGGHDDRTADKGLRHAERVVDRGGDAFERCETSRPDVARGERARLGLDDAHAAGA